MPIIYLLLFVVSTFAANAEEVRPTHFAPGIYTLEKGKKLACSEGEFRIYDMDGPKIAIGPFFIFSLEPGRVQIEDNMDPSKTCSYDVQQRVHNRANYSELVFRSEHICAGKTRHVLNRIAKVTVDRAEVNVVQTGTPAFEYTCSWVLTRRDVNSMKKPDLRKEAEKASSKK